MIWQTKMEDRLQFFWLIVQVLLILVKWLSMLTNEQLNFMIEEVSVNNFVKVEKMLEMKKKLFCSSCTTYYLNLIIKDIGQLL